MFPENLEHPKEPDKNPEQEKPLKSKVICAWCNKEMGEREGIEGGKSSHGICPSCREKYFPRPNEKRE